MTNISSKDLLSSTFKVCHLGQWSFTLGTKPILSEMACSILGLSATDNIKDQFSIKILPEDLNMVKETQFYKAIFGMSAEPLIPETFVFRWQGNLEQRVIRVISGPLPEAPNKPTIIGVFEDITELVRVYDNSLIHHSKMATLGKITSSIAHEINNPLSILSGYVSYLQKKVTPDKENSSMVLDVASKIEKTVFRIIKIINGIKLLSNENHYSGFEKINLNEVLLETITLCMDKCASHGIQIKLTGAEKYEIQCRPVQLSQIIMNLILNSIDAIKNLDNRWIDISFTKIEDNLEISVKDSGNGIEPEVVSKMMSPFYSTKRRGEGTGLGLAISSEIIRQHGGELIYNASTVNTEFIVRMPFVNSKVFEPGQS